MRRLGGLAALLVLTASALLTTASEAEAAVSAAAQQLASAYAPIVKLRKQTQKDNCSTTQEQYSPPTTIDTVLSNPAVRLIHYVNGEEVPVKRAPTAADIAGLGDDYYLDLPGDPLDVKCPERGSYATDFKALRDAGRAPAVTYAHIATEPGYSGLVVQYFFFYYFNQFNDVHEGDWEGMQISFDADTPAEALAKGPSQIALFQHAGGERADWSDQKVQKEGTHPVVYSAAGSHATFYDNAIYIENGSHGSGVGCDNTTDPLIRTAPRPVVVPTASAPGSQFQWLSYLGHWGQREKGFNIGPQGPTTKKQWLRPFTWMSGIRQTSPRLPGGSVLGPAASTVFCGAIATVSEFINLEAKTTIGAILIGVILLLLIVIPVLLTRWRPVDISTLRHRWAVGQLLRGARQLYGRHWRTMLAIAMTGFVLLAAIQGVEYLFAQLTNSNHLRIHVFGGTLRFNGSIGVIAHPVGFALVSGAVVAFVRLREAGEASGVRDDFRAIWARLWRVVGGELLVDLLATLMLITVVGIPFAIYFYIAWQFVQQEILFEDRSIREALRGSHRLVRGHWWRTVIVTGILALIGVMFGPILGFFLIFLNLSPVLVNLIGSVVYALVVPYVALGRTLLYLDLSSREEAERAAGLVRRHWFSRARPAAGTS
jgi:hypothetical protein